jgi:sugar O-acyltransferase (sialic acid O-acetyltransferase NeuD family)
MPRLLIIGAGAQARQILTIVGLTRVAEVAGLIDTFDNPAVWGQHVAGAKVWGSLSALEQFPPKQDLRVILAVANLARKRELAARLEQQGHEFMTVVHPTAIVPTSAIVGRGCIINAGVILENNVRLGRHVIVHAGAILEHDNVLDDFVNIGTGVRTGGRVRFSEGATIFTGAIVIPDRVIGADAVVGAGAGVFHDVPPGYVVMGSPARAVRRND